MRKNPSHTPKIKTKPLKHLFHPTTIPLASLTALLTFLAISPLSLTAPPTSATSSEAAIGANLATAVHLSAPDFALVFKPTAAGSEVLQTVTKNVKVGTNNKTGYTLTMSSSSAQTDLINTSDSSQHILSLQDNQGTALTDVTPAAFPANQWGISTDSGSTYDALTPSTTTVTLKTTAAPSNEDLVPITVGTKANLALASGTYTNTMTFTAVTNAVPTTYSITYNANGGTGAPAAQTADSFNTSYTFTLSSTTPTKDGYNFSGWCKSTEVSGDTCTGTLYQAGATSPTLTSASPSVTLKAIWGAPKYMQNVGTWGSSLALGESVQAVDLRDNKVYWVTRVKTSNDGSTSEIWMTQNLDYDLSNASLQTLSPATSDVTESTTLTPGTTIKDVGIIEFRELGNLYLPNAGKTSDAEVYVDASTLPSDSQSLHYHAGNLYTYYAAVAASQTIEYNGGPDEGWDFVKGDAPGSICPAGWRIPTLAYSGNFNFYQAIEAQGFSQDQSLITGSPLYLVGDGKVSSSGYVDGYLSSYSVGDPFGGYPGAMYWVELWKALDRFFISYMGLSDPYGTSDELHRVRCVARSS